MKIRVDYYCTRPDLYLYLTNLQDLSIIIFQTVSVMGLLACVLRPSGPTHDRPPLFLYIESRRLGIHGTKSRQQPSSA
jgi:hypothetical protein